ncbi:hypothetical protein HDU88_003615 [Geranomyces variabilis]|nr:hypothetical protein HDU88_003615 [Geranomyces variabilis]
MSNDGNVASVTASIVVSAPAQLHLLLEAHASALRFENISDSDLHLDFRQPLTTSELPAFTWLSIIYLCSKQCSWQPALEERNKLPPPVWHWIEELVYLSAPRSKDIEDVALKVFAELRSVCLSWIAPVGLRRAASIWNLISRPDFRDVLKDKDEQLRNVWFQVRGPEWGDFRYEDEVRLELDPELIRLSDSTPTQDFMHPRENRPVGPLGSLQAENTTVSFKRKITYFQPFTNNDRWIADETRIFKKDSRHLRNHHFVYAVGILWAVERAQRIQDVDNEHASLPNGLLSSVDTARGCSEGKLLDCVQLEMSHPFRCAICLSDDQSTKVYHLEALRRYRGTKYVGFPGFCTSFR